MTTSAGKRKTTMGSSDVLKAKRLKRQVSKEMFHKWQQTYKREHQFMVWLCADTDDLDKKSLVSTLWCIVCWKYKTRIHGLKNFSSAWINGSSNHKTSNITDHTNNKQHKSAMMFLHKEHVKSRNESVTTYSPIASSLLALPMDLAMRKQVKKFDISFVLAKERIPFMKCPTTMN